MGGGGIFTTRADYGDGGDDRCRLPSLLPFFLLPRWNMAPTNFLHLHETRRAAASDASWMMREGGGVIVWLFGIHPIKTDRKLQNPSETEVSYGVKQNYHYIYLRKPRICFSGTLISFTLATMFCSKLIVVQSKDSAECLLSSIRTLWMLRVSNLQCERSVELASGDAGVTRGFPLSPILYYLLSSPLNGWVRCCNEKGQ